MFCTNTKQIAPANVSIPEAASVSAFNFVGKSEPWKESTGTFKKPTCPKKIKW